MGSEREQRNVLYINININRICDMITYRPVYCTIECDVIFGVHCVASLSIPYWYSTRRLALFITHLRHSYPYIYRTPPVQCSAVQSYASYLNIYILLRYMLYSSLPTFIFLLVRTQFAQLSSFIHSSRRLSLNKLRCPGYRLRHHLNPHIIITTITILLIILPHIPHFIRQQQLTLHYYRRRLLLL